jgi:luciferase family oxidoreductase group 1
VKYSALDLFPVEDGKKPSQVIHDAARVTRHTESLGFERYWVAEHHNMPSIASAAPEVLITYLAGQTKTIRIGAGGIMLPNHNPLHVVEVFRTLEALYPGRIDMGIGRAPGTDPLTASALQRSGEPVNQQIAELNAFIHAKFPDGHPYARIVAMPTDVTCPPFWMLGSTDGGARIAANLGLPFAFAGHFSLEHAREAFTIYYNDFTPGALAKPQTLLALSVICAETDALAEELAGPIRTAFALIRRGVVRPFPSVASVKANPLSAADREITKNMIVGGPARVRDQLAKMIDAYRPDEVMLATAIADPELRMRSYTLSTRGD